MEHFGCRYPALSLRDCSISCPSSNEHISLFLSFSLSLSPSPLSPSAPSTPHLEGRGRLSRALRWAGGWNNIRTVHGSVHSSHTTSTLRRRIVGQRGNIGQFRQSVRISVYSTKKPRCPTIRLLNVEVVLLKWTLIQYMVSLARSLVFPSSVFLCTLFRLK